MFISNNRASFYLWWKENLVIHQKVSKYYENDCILVSLRYSVSISYVRQSSQLTQFLWTQFFLSLTVQNVGNSFLEQRPYLLLKFQMKNYHRHPRIRQWLSTNWDFFLLLLISMQITKCESLNWFLFSLSTASVKSITWLEHCLGLIISILLVTFTFGKNMFKNIFFETKN